MLMVVSFSIKSVVPYFESVRKLKKEKPILFFRMGLIV